MSDTKHKYSGAVGREYHLAVVEKKDKEIAALRAAAEKAREALENLTSIAAQAMKDANQDCGDYSIATELYEAESALAALEEVLK